MSDLRVRLPTFAPEAVISGDYGFVVVPSHDMSTTQSKHKLPNTKEKEDTREMGELTKAIRIMSLQLTKNSGPGDLSTARSG